MLLCCAGRCLVVGTCVFVISEGSVQGGVLYYFVFFNPKLYR